MVDFEASLGYYAIRLRPGCRVTITWSSDSYIYTGISFMLEFPIRPFQLRYVRKSERALFTTLTAMELLLRTP